MLSFAKLRIQISLQWRLLRTCGFTLVKAERVLRRWFFDLFWRSGAYFGQNIWNVASFTAKLSYTTSRWKLYLKPKKRITLVVYPCVGDIRHWIIGSKGWLAYTYHMWVTCELDNIPLQDIYGFEGCKTLRREMTHLSWALPAWFPIYSAKVPIYYVQDCRSHKYPTFGSRF